MGFQGFFSNTFLWLPAVPSQASGALLTSAGTQRAKLLKPTTGDPRKLQGPGGGGGAHSDLVPSPSLVQCDQ